MIQKPHQPFPTIHNLHFSLIQKHPPTHHLPFSLLLIHPQDQILTTHTIHLLPIQIIQISKKMNTFSKYISIINQFLL
ncbi:PTS lactose/cellobiose transporter subunit IIA [Bacillus pumilus]|uniref:PTS lactose/cellobiose transporter subunit IIA n=1 Tax=Bacillus pumilus TaxID=1408 RepID=UPI0021B44D57|nr:PTS lactose/cellobiose transporter subunit IIA [Bacillus pumilus]